MKQHFAAVIAGAIIFALGWGFAMAKGPALWALFINGQRSKVPIHLLNNTYYVALTDLAQVPGWKATIDLTAKKVWLRTTGANMTANPPVKPAASNANATSQTAASGSVDTVASVSADSQGNAIEETSANAGPPNNVRLTVEAALASLNELNQAFQNNLPVDDLKQKNQTTQNMVKQAENLLWNLPRTRTLQADLQVATEDLQSQLSLATAGPQAQNGILPWLHPTAEAILMKYPDLHPCRITQGKVDGVDMGCAKKMLSDVTREDFNDIQRDLEQYR